MAERGRPRGFDRAQALRRALEVFWEKGYEGATLSELTTAMGIGSPSLYAAFGSKEALFREALALYTASEGTQIWEALPAAPTARAAIERFLAETVAAYSRDDRPRGCLIVLGALNETPGSAAVCRELRGQRLDNLAQLRERFERAVAEGELPTGFDCAAAARFYATVQQGLSIQARDGAGRAELQAVADAAMAAWPALADG